MGTEVLMPQDCLGERYHFSPSSFHHRRKYSPATANGRGFTGNNNLHRNTTSYGHRNPAVFRPKKPQYQETTNPKRLASFDDFKVVPKNTKNNLNQNNSNSYNNRVLLNENSSHNSNSCNSRVLSKEDPSHIENANNVMILRRGASLDSVNVRIKKDHNNNEIINNHAKIVPLGMHRFGLYETTYAGSAFSASPSPSDLPLPTFFKKHQSFDDSATRMTQGLRRLLRLE